MNDVIQDDQVTMQTVTNNSTGVPIGNAQLGAIDVGDMVFFPLSIDDDAGRSRFSQQSVFAHELDETYLLQAKYQFPQDHNRVSEADYVRAHNKAIGVENEVGGYNRSANTKEPLLPVRPAPVRTQRFLENSSTGFFLFHWLSPSYRTHVVEYTNANVTGYRTVEGDQRNEENPH